MLAGLVPDDSLQSLDDWASEIRIGLIEHREDVQRLDVPGLGSFSIVRSTKWSVHFEPAPASPDADPIVRAIHAAVAAGCDEIELPGLGVLRVGASVEFATDRSLLAALQP